MPTTSSLLRSAESARKKTIAYEDQVAAFNWENSAKTIDDYNKYGAYLQKRSETFMNADPSASLSYQTKLRTATRAYRSEEIQRASIDVLQGRGSLTDKYNKVYSLYQGAIENGDMNSVQNLTQQLSSLDVQIQNEQERQQRFAETAAKTRTTDAIKMADKILSGDNKININGKEISPLTLLDSAFKDNGYVQKAGDNYFTYARTTIEAAAAKLAEALSLVTTQEDYDRIAGKIADLQTKGFSTPAGSLNYGDIIRAEMMHNAGNPLFVPAAGTFNSATQNQEYKMQKQKVDDIVWGRDQDGRFIPIETTAREGDSLDTVFDDKGKPVEQYKKDQFGNYQLDKKGNKIVNKDYNKFKESGFTLKNMLEKQGLDAYAEGDSLYVRSPSGKLGDVGGVPVRIVIGADGKIKYVRENDKGLGFFEIDPLTGATKEIARPFNTAGYTTVGNKDITQNKPGLFGLELLQKTLPGAGFDLLSQASKQVTGLDALMGKTGPQQSATLDELKRQGYVTPLAPDQIKNRVPTPIIPLAQQALGKATSPQPNAALQAFQQSATQAKAPLTPQQLQQQGFVTPLKPIAVPAPTPTATNSVFSLASNAIQPKKLPF